MKRTRRAALAMIAGSSGLLAVDTIGFSSGEAERDLSVEVVSDADAYLGLVETDASEDVETGGILFEDDSDRRPIASFDVTNQLTEELSLALELEDDRFRFHDDNNDDDANSVEIDDGRLRTESDLEPGDVISVGIDLDLRSAQPVGESITTPLEIEATGETTHIEAERSLTLLPGVVGVVDLCPKGALIVRKRRNGDDVQLLVEWVSCSTDGRTRVTSIEVFDCPLPQLLLSFPAETFGDEESDSGDASTATVDGTGTATASDSESSFEPEIETAAYVEAKINPESSEFTATSESTANDGTETVAESTDESSSSAPVLEIDPDTGDRTALTGDLETVDILLADLENE